MSFQALGKVAVATAGTPVQAYNGSPLRRCREITIQAALSNTKNIYVGSKGLVVSTATALRSTLAPGQSDTISSEGSGSRLNPEDVWLDSDVNGEFANVSLS